MNNNANPLTKRQGRPRKAVALYITVLSIALITSLLGMAGLVIVRIERRTASISTSLLEARNNARSAVELALRVIANDSNWTSTYANGVETTPQSLGPGGNGTLSWIVEDSDGSLSDAATELRLKGVGRVGSTVQVSSVSVTLPQVGPIELRSVTGTDSELTGDVAPDTQWCQYLKPTLPADAIRWWVTSVEFYCMKSSGGTTFDIRIFEPESNNWPSDTVIDEASFNANDYEPQWAWNAFDLSGTYSLDPNEGICLAVMTSETKKIPISIAYLSGGVSEADSALIQGDPTWASYDAAKALRYRVHGIYTTSSGGVSVVEGSWVWDVAP